MTGVAPKVYSKKVAKKADISQDIREAAARAAA